jgi:hypothetical protein
VKEQIEAQLAEQQRMIDNIKRSNLDETQKLEAPPPPTHSFTHSRASVQVDTLSHADTCLLGGAIFGARALACTCLLHAS